MARTRTAKTQAPQSTAQQLASLIKSCRDIMRKDKGLSGDLDRLPMLTWIMFLKFLDDMEQIEESRAKLGRKKYRPAIEPPYRWRDWAANEQGITGPELLAFINQDEAARPDGKRGAGLFAYLRSLRSTNGDRRDIIAKVFEGTVNRMVSGYLLRDVINKVNEIHFTSQDEIHTLGQLYESMLREMRDAAGDSGEFYTPRAVVKFIVTAVATRQACDTRPLVHGRSVDCRVPVVDSMKIAPASSSATTMRPSSSRASPTGLRNSGIAENILGATLGCSRSSM